MRKLGFNLPVNPYSRNWRQSPTRVSLTLKMRKSACLVAKFCFGMCMVGGGDICWLSIIPSNWGIRFPPIMEISLHWLHSNLLKNETGLNKSCRLQSFCIRQFWWGSLRDGNPFQDCFRNLKCQIKSQTQIWRTNSEHNHRPLVGIQNRGHCKMKHNTKRQWFVSYK